MSSAYEHVARFIQQVAIHDAAAPTAPAPDPTGR
jgi:hypothetical protein